MSNPGIAQNRDSAQEDQLPPTKRRVNHPKNHTKWVIKQRQTAESSNHHVVG